MFAFVYRIQDKDYSKKDLFIYMGLTKDSDQAVTFLNQNQKIKIIDATYGMEFKNEIDELWLNPSNLLMIAQNIKNGLGEYITSTYLLKKIDNRYLELKVNLSSLDAEYKTSIENANYNNKKFPNNIYINNYASILAKGPRYNTKNLINLSDLYVIKEEEIDEHSSLWKGHATQEFIEFIDSTVNKIKNGQDTSNIYWLQEEK